MVDKWRVRPVRSSCQLDSARAAASLEIGSGTDAAGADTGSDATGVAAAAVAAAAVFLDADAFLEEAAAAGAAAAGAGAAATTTAGDAIFLLTDFLEEAAVFMVVLDAGIVFILVLRTN